MDTTAEKLNISTENITEKEIEETREVEKKKSSNDQYCLKALDYFVF